MMSLIARVRPRRQAVGIGALAKVNYDLADLRLVRASGPELTWRVFQRIMNRATKR